MHLWRVERVRICPVLGDFLIYLAAQIFIDKAQDAADYLDRQLSGFTSPLDVTYQLGRFHISPCIKITTSIGEYVRMFDLCIIQLNLLQRGADLLKDYNLYNPLRSPCRVYRWVTLAIGAEVRYPFLTMKAS